VAQHVAAGLQHLADDARRHLPSVISIAVSIIDNVKPSPRTRSAECCAARPAGHVLVEMMRIGVGRSSSAKTLLRQLVEAFVLPSVSSASKPMV